MAFASCPPSRTGACRSCAPAIRAYPSRDWRDRRTPAPRRRSGGSELGVRLGRRRHADHRNAAEYQVDANQQAERPQGRARQSGNDDAGEDEIDDAADQHPAPASAQLIAMFDGVHDGGHALDNEKGCQHQSQRQRPVTGQRSSSAPATMPTTAETSDHQNPGAWRIQNVVTSPTTPEMRNSQPIRMVKAIVATIGTRMAAMPRMRSTMPSIRKSTQ